MPVHLKKQAANHRYNCDDEEESPKKKRKTPSSKGLVTEIVYFFAIILGKGKQTEAEKKMITKDDDPQKYPPHK